MAAEPIRSKKDVKKLIRYYFVLKQWRNYLLIVMGINTALRISDLLGVRWEDVYDFAGKRFRTHLTLREKKTGKSQSIILNTAIIEALKLYMGDMRGSAQALGAGVFLFAGNRRGADGIMKPIGRQQAFRIIKEAAGQGRAASKHPGKAILTKVSCHSLRKTFGYHAWRSGAHVVVLMEIYNHSSYAVTRRYLGIEQDERDAVFRMVRLG